MTPQDNDRRVKNYGPKRHQESGPLSSMPADFLLTNLSPMPSASSPMKTACPMVVVCPPYAQIMVFPNVCKKQICSCGCFFHGLEATVLVLLSSLAPARERRRTREGTGNAAFLSARGQGTPHSSPRGDRERRSRHAIAQLFLGWPSPRIDLPPRLLTGLRRGRKSGYLPLVVVEIRLRRFLVYKQSQYTRSHTAAYHPTTTQVSSPF